MAGAAAASLAVVVACGGGAASSGLFDAGDCVDFELTSADVSCGSDADCVLLETGTVCELACCTGTVLPANLAAATRFANQTARLPVVGCPSAPGPLCSEYAPPACVDGVCVPCDADGGSCAN